MNSYSIAPIQRVIVKWILGVLSLVNVVLLITSGANFSQLAQICCVTFGIVAAVLYSGEVSSAWRVNHKFTLALLFLNSCTVAFLFDLNPSPVYLFIPSFIISIAVLNQRSSVRGAAVIHLLAVVVCYVRGAGSIELTYFPYMMLAVVVCVATVASVLQVSSNKKHFFKVSTSEKLLEQKRTTLKHKTESFREKSKELRLANEELEVRASENIERVKYLTTTNGELGQIAKAAGQYLKAPLQVIGLNVDQIGKRLYKLDQEEGLTEYLHFVSDGTARMNAMVDDLLHYCDTSVNRNPSLVSTCEVLDVIECNLSNLLVREQAHLIIEEGLPSILGHKTEILQLFQNLICNGIKFRKPTGTPVCRVGYSISDHEVCFSVSDNGIGIPPNRVKDVFGLFTRLHERTDYEGTGIGLALCRRIVLAAGGEIWAESSEREGTTFYFTWPKQSVNSELNRSKKSALQTT